MAIRVYIVEDHPVMRETLRDYLALTPDLELCGMAPHAEAAATALPELSPDVVVLDLSLPGRSGLDLLAEIRERWGTPCVILSGHDEHSYVGRALAFGARGYVLKGYPGDLLVAIRSVVEGKVHLSDPLLQRLDLEVAPALH